jgi:serine/threonine-protein kinase
MTDNPPVHPEINEVIGQRYLILRQLREEPWGGVWLAQDNLLRTEVSLKLLARDDPKWASSRDMFEHAAILGQKLRHPQILGVFHVDKAERFLYLVEEPFPGESLLARLSRQERFNMPQTLQLLELLSQALAFAHQQGKVHQSFSPINILLMGEELRLANFAFAPVYDEQPLHLELKAYAAPEVIHGDRLTPAGNVFSLGVLGFRLAAGSLPYPLTFDEPFPYRLEYPPMDLEEIPFPLQNLLLRCLAEDPEERLLHAGAVVHQLRQAQELMHGAGKKPFAARRQEKPPADRRPLALAGPLLRKIWEAGKPGLQKAKDAMLNLGNMLKQAPRRLWWGVGLAVLMLVLIIGGAKWVQQAGSRPRPASAPQPAPVVAPVALAPMGGGPPLMETGEATPAPDAGLAAKPAAKPAAKTAAKPAPALASPGAPEERYLLVVATYGDMKPAQALQQRLRAQGHKAVVVTSKTGGKTLYLVRVGPLSGAKAAQDAAGRIKSQVKINPQVVKLAPRPAGASNRRPSP